MSHLLLNDNRTQIVGRYGGTVVNSYGVTTCPLWVQVPNKPCPHTYVGLTILLWDGVACWSCWITLLQLPDPQPRTLKAAGSVPPVPRSRSGFRANGLSHFALCYSATSSWKNEFFSSSVGCLLWCTLWVRSVVVCRHRRRLKGRLAGLLVFWSSLALGPKFSADVYFCARTFLR